MNRKIAKEVKINIVGIKMTFGSMPAKDAVTLLSIATILNIICWIGLTFANAWAINDIIANGASFLSIATILFTLNATISNKG